MRVSRRSIQRGFLYTASVRRAVFEPICSPERPGIGLVRPLVGSVRGPVPRSKPETVALAKELHGKRMSLRKIAAELAARGHLTAYGKPYVASAVQSILG
jgi:hypothetical protein